MIIAYCRPFSGGEKNSEKRVPILPASFLKGLSEEEKEIHEVVMSDRNTVLAHSDSSAFDFQPEVLEVGNKAALMPWSNDTRAPLTRKGTERLQALAGKLMQKALEERMKLEREVSGVFIRIPIDQIIAEMEKETG